MPQDNQRDEQDVCASVWCRAKRAVMPALSRPSYRSILALLLLMIVEVPTEQERYRVCAVVHSRSVQPIEQMAQHCKMAIGAHIAVGSIVAKQLRVTSRHYPYGIN